MAIILDPKNIPERTSTRPLPADAKPPVRDFPGCSDPHLTVEEVDEFNAMIRRMRRYGIEAPAQPE